MCGGVDLLALSEDDRRRFRISLQPPRRSLPLFLCHRRFLRRSLRSHPHLLFRNLPKM